MNLRNRIAILSLVLPWLGSATAARAAPLLVEAGQTHTLHEDIILNGDDVLEVRGTAEKPSVLVGDRHRIRSGGKWTGSLRITHCTIRDLGGLPRRTADDQVQGPGDPAFDLNVAVQGRVVIEHCILDACSAIRLQTDETSTASFRHNSILENAAIAISKDIANSGDCFTATGTSREKKWFQGNFIPRGKVVLRGANWLVGGDRDADSNLFIGHRIGIVADGAGTVVRGNYFHLLMPITREYPYWSQISVFTAGPGVVGEHNVIRDGEWIVRFVEGEFRYNVITDIVDHDLMQNGSNGRVHHNLFLAGTSNHRW